MPIITSSKRLSAFSSHPPLSALISYRLMQTMRNANALFCLLDALFMVTSNYLTTRRSGRSSLRMRSILKLKNGKFLQLEWRWTRTIRFPLGSVRPELGAAIASRITADAKWRRRQLKHLLPAHLMASFSPFFSQAGHFPRHSKRALRDGNGRRRCRWSPTSQPLLPPVIRKACLTRSVKRFYKTLGWTLITAMLQDTRRQAEVMPLVLVLQGSSLPKLMGRVWVTFSPYNLQTIWRNRR